MTERTCHLPPVANDTISRAVKSGFLKTSTSKSSPQGSTFINSGALLTRVSYFALSCLLTIAVKPFKYEGQRKSVIQSRCGSTFPLRSTTIRINISFNKLSGIPFSNATELSETWTYTNVWFDNWSYIFYPKFRCILVILDGSAHKSVLTFKICSGRV